MTLSVFVFSVTEQKVDVPRETIVFAIQILLELALGFILGMVMNFFFYIVQLAGLTVDTQMGMTMNQIYDAGAQSNLSVTGEILNVLMTLLFFAANGHHTLLRMMVTSGQIVGFGGVAIGPGDSTAEVAHGLGPFHQLAVQPLPEEAASHGYSRQRQCPQAKANTGEQQRGQHGDDHIQHDGTGGLMAPGFG